MCAAETMVDRAPTWDNYYALTLLKYWLYMFHPYQPYNVSFEVPVTLKIHGEMGLFHSWILLKFLYRHVQEGCTFFFLDVSRYLFNTFQVYYCKKNQQKLFWFVFPASSQFEVLKSPVWGCQLVRVVSSNMHDVMKNFCTKAACCPRLSRKLGTLKLIRPSIRLSVCHKNLNLSHIFWSINDRALIFGLHDPCDKSFLLVPCGDRDLGLRPTSRSNLLPGGRPQFFEFLATKICFLFQLHQLLYNVIRMLVSYKNMFLISVIMIS